MSSYGKRLADVNEAIELIKFPLYKFGFMAYEGEELDDEDIIEFNSWEDIF